MASRLFDRRKLSGLAVAGLAVLIAGCQSGNPLGALNMGGGDGGVQQQAAAPDDRITVEELRAYCPSASIRTDGVVHSSYQRNAQDDPSALIYQASVSDVTRACTYQGGMTNITVAVAGRVVPGPQGQPGTVTLPMRITVFRDTEEIQSQAVSYQVAVADVAGATQFVFTDASITIPNPTARNIRVVVGFEPAATARR